MTTHSPNLVQAMSLLALSTALAAVEAHAATPSCQDVEYSKTVLDRLPNIAKHCLRVEQQKDGRLTAVVEMEVTRTYHRNAVEVRVKEPDGRKSEPRYIETSPDRRVLVEGKPTRVRDLAVGQKLTAYVDVKEALIAPAPASADGPWEYVPLRSEPPADVAAPESRPPR